MTVVATTLLKTRVGGADERNVAFLPGGLGYNLGADDQGKVFYVLLPENGSVLKTITESSGFDGPSGAHLGMGIAPTTTVAPNEIRNSIKNRALFTADSEGNVLYCNTSDDVSGWTLKSVFQLKDLISNKAVVIPNAIGVGRAFGNDVANDMWLFCGSGPLDAPDPDPGTGLPRGIINAQNYIVAFSQSKTEKDNLSRVTLDDLERLKYAKDIGSSLPDYGDTLTAEDNKLSPKDIYGWYLALRPAQSMIDAGTTVGTRPEYVTTPPYLYNSVLYVTTFIPWVRGTDEYEVCPDLGHAKFYAIDPLTGKGMWPGDGQAFVLEDIKITGISAAGGRLYFGMQALSSTAVDSLKATLKAKGIEVDVLLDGTMFSIQSLSEASGELPFSPEEPYIQYWRDIVNP
jgi:hypothetical protein